MKVSKDKARTGFDMLCWLATRPNQEILIKDNPFKQNKERANWINLKRHGLVEFLVNSEDEGFVKLTQAGSMLTEGSTVDETGEVKCLPRPVPSWLLDTVSSPLALDNKLCNQAEVRCNRNRPNRVEIKSTTNQGRGAEIKWKHLSFRSDHEVAIAAELDTTGVMFFPNAAVRLTEHGKRVTKEVDFLVCKDGHWGILEVDGCQHRESRAEDMMRDDIFTDAGVWFIRRYPATICKQKPVWVAQDFISRLEAYYSRLK